MNSDEFRILNIKLDFLLNQNKCIFELLSKFDSILSDSKSIVINKEICSDSFDHGIWRGPNDWN